MNVFDASALLAFLQGEEGASMVEAALAEGGACGTGNWSEVAQKLRAHDRDWDLAKALLLSFDLELEPVSVADAERAAEQWRAGQGFCLGDRLCMALGSRLDAVILTADSSWGTEEAIRQIR